MRYTHARWEYATAIDWQDSDERRGEVLSLPKQFDGRNARCNDKFIEHAECRPSLLEGSGQNVGRVLLHGLTQSNEDSDGRLALAPLDVVDVLAGDTGLGGQFFLRQSGGEAGFFQFRGQHGCKR